MLTTLLLLFLATGDATGRHVAHAGGAIDRIDYSNAREALVHNHARGFRLFELDFNWTSDGAPVLIHDWGVKWDSLFGGGARPDHAGFMQAPMRAGLTQLDLPALVDWMQAYPDAWVVTDAKDRNIDLLRAFTHAGPDVVERVIPQVYGFEEYEQARKLGFERVILTVYRLDAPPEDVVRWAARVRPFAVTVPAYTVESGRFDALLALDGVPVYVHTVNDPDRWQRLRAQGVDGVYTDTIAPPAAVLPSAPAASR